MPKQFHHHLAKALRGKTAYQIAIDLGGKGTGDTKHNRIQYRWQHWLAGKNLKSIQTLADDLTRLGFELVIKKKD